MSNSSVYQPPAHGWRTFWIVWLTQSFSALGSQLTFFAIIIWLTQVLYPRPEQKPELAFAISAAFASVFPRFSARRLPVRLQIGMTASGR